MKFSRDHFLKRPSQGIQQYQREKTDNCHGSSQVVQHRLNNPHNIFVEAEVYGPLSTGVEAVVIIQLSLPVISL